MNTQNQAIGHGSFFKRRPYDYTDDELNLLQGHKDCIRTVDLLPKDVQCHTEVDDDSMLATDWLEQTGELRPSLDVSFRKGTFTHFTMDDLHTEYGNFYMHHWTFPAHMPVSCHGA